MCVDTPDVYDYSLPLISVFFFNMCNIVNEFFMNKLVLTSYFFHPPKAPKKFIKLLKNLNTVLKNLKFAGCQAEL